jgi:excisionase family DNA binding protein
MTVPSCDTREQPPETESRVEAEASEATWTVDEASAFLKLAPKTLYKWAASGVVPSFKLGGRRRFNPKTLATWLAAQQGGGR